MESRGYEDMMNFMSMPSGHADIYSRSAGKVLLKSATYLVKGLETYKGGVAIEEDEEVILDIGCGTGETTKLFLDALPNVKEAIAMDIDESFLDRARSTVDSDKVTFMHMDAESDWPEDWDGKFTKIFSNYTFHWIRDHEKMLKQIRRVLRPGGELICQFFHSTTTQDEIRAVKKAAMETGVAEIIKKSMAQRAEQPWKSTDNYINLAKMMDLSTTTCHIVPRALKVRSKLERAGMALSITPIMAALPVDKRSHFALKYAENLADPLSINHNVIFLRMHKSLKTC